MNELRLDRYFFLGLFVLVSVTLNQYVNFSKYRDPLEILWFCDMTALILGMGLILKNRLLLSLTIVMAIPAQFMWIVDFFLEFLGYGIGRTRELFSFGSIVFWFSVNLHAILIPISFYATWKLGFNKKVLPFALLYVFFLLNTSYFFTSISENRNCVFYGCDEKDPGSGYAKYFFVNSLLYWEIVLLVSFFLQRKFFLFFEKKKHSKSG